MLLEVIGYVVYIRIIVIIRAKAILADLNLDIMLIFGE